MSFWDIWELIAYLICIIPGLIDMVIKAVVERGEKNAE